MKKYIKIFPAAPFFATVLLTAVLLTSCDLFHDFFKNTENSKKEEKDPYTFYALDMSTKVSFSYPVTAEKLAEGEKCVVWAESDRGVTREKAKAIANEYDKVIRPRIVNAFGKKDFDAVVNGKTEHFADILDYANRLASETDETDGKLTILLLDIRDGYDPKTKPSYVAGYFYSGDFYRAGPIGAGYYSNGRDMIYIDTNPGMQKPEQAYSTFAHELQHLISYATSRQMNKARLMDTWIDEGLSSQAEHIYLGSHPTEKCNWFKNDTNGTIAKGNNFFVWDNHSGQAILDDYATVYMFFRWLRLQAGDDSIFRDIVTSTGYDHNIIVDLAKQINPAWDTWEKVLRAWMIANYYPADSTYGYKNDADLHKYIVPKLASGRLISLYPGEGVYSKIDKSFSPAINGGRNIRYAGINTGTPSLSPPYTGEALLTFNSNATNSNTATLQETGYLTGVTGSVAAARETAASVQETGFSGPYVIDARDVLGRNGDREFPVFSEPFLQRAEE